MNNHREHVGPVKLFDKIGQHQLDVLEATGLKNAHRVLDYGCGCLRLGKHLIPRLYKNRYFGVEVSEKSVLDGLLYEVDGTIVKRKNPQFAYVQPEQFVIPSQFNGKQIPYFDTIMAHSIFTHASKAQIAALLEEIVERLRNGRVLATFNIGDDWNGKGWSYPIGHTFTENTMLGLFAGAGLNAAIFEAEHPTGQTWVIATRT